MCGKLLPARSAFEAVCNSTTAKHLTYESPLIDGQTLARAGHVQHQSWCSDVGRAIPHCLPHLHLWPFVCLRDCHASQAQPCIGKRQARMFGSARQACLQKSVKPGNGGPLLTWRAGAGGCAPAAAVLPLQPEPHALRGRRAEARGGSGGATGKHSPTACQQLLSTSAESLVLLA